MLMAIIRYFIKFINYYYFYKQIIIIIFILSLIDFSRKLIAYYFYFLHLNFNYFNLFFIHIINLFLSNNLDFTITSVPTTNYFNFNHHHHYLPIQYYNYWNFHLQIIKIT